MSSGIATLQAKALGPTGHLADPRTPRRPHRRPDHDRTPATTPEHLRSQPILISAHPRPELANLVERTMALRAADGITFLPLSVPTDLLGITGEVVPLLAGRGLFRTGRPGAGLRARFQTAAARNAS